MTVGDPFDFANLESALADAAVPADAAPMQAYLKDRFVFLGIKTPQRRQASKPFIAAGDGADPGELLATASRLWEYEPREYQYVGCDLLKRWGRRLEPDAIEGIEHLITTKSWWDTVDVLAAHVVGSLVSRHPDLVAVMDDWVSDDNIWLARSAIIHQLFYKESTDADRLFAYAIRQMGHTDFFIRKAIGWSLRQYARTDEAAVVAFVEANADNLSGLTKREALKHVTVADAATDND